MSTEQLVEALLNAATNARHWFEGNPEGALAEIEHRAQALAAYRATAPAIPMCERCNGTGRQFVGGHESEAICRTCDGAGYVATAPAAGEGQALADEVCRRLRFLRIITDELMLKQVACLIQGVSETFAPPAPPAPAAQAEPLTVQACRPEGRAMLQTVAGAEMVLKAALAIGGSYTCPICGTATPHSHSGAEIVAWRRAQGKTMLYNPFTGCPRDQADIEEDPSGIFLTAVASVPRKKWAPSAAALQAELPAVPECERCGLSPDDHTASHWCDNQSFALPAAKAAWKAREPLTEAECMAVCADWITVPSESVRMIRAIEAAHGISAIAQAGEGAES